MLSELSEKIQNGLTSKRDEVSNELKQNGACRDELSLNNGVIFKSDKVVIHTNLRSEMVKLLHISHKGIEKTKLRVRKSVFWPGVNIKIKDMVKEKEPVIASDIAVYQFQTVGTYLFH